MSFFFNKTANDSGFETRVIHSDGICHYWNEVNINGEWKFFDVQKYGEIKNMNNASYWFGNTSDYAKVQSFSLDDMINKVNIKGEIAGIFVYDANNNGYGENRNDAYDPNHFYYRTS